MKTNICFNPIHWSFCNILKILLRKSELYFLILSLLLSFILIQLICGTLHRLLGWAAVLHCVLIRMSRRFVHPRWVDGFSPSRPRLEMTVYPRLLTPGSLLAAVSGCGGDFEDLHNLSLLAVGFVVTPAINIWFSPLVWFWYYLSQLLQLYLVFKAEAVFLFTLTEMHWLLGAE